MRKLSFMALVLTLVVTVAVSAAVPTEINYQGRLTNAGGDPVPDGNHSVTFTIYDTPVAGVIQWTSGIRQVTVSGGLFSYLLGENVPLPEGLFSNNTGLWLGMTVGADTEISPRTKFSSAPIAAVARGVDGDILTSPGKIILDDGFGTDNSVVLSSAASNLDHRGHVTILKVAGGGTDTTNMVGLFGDPDFDLMRLGDLDPTDSGIVVETSAHQLGHHGHVTILKVAGGGTDTTNMVGLFGDPDFDLMRLGDLDPTDSGIVVETSAHQLDHHGHVTILKVAGGGTDTTNLVGLFGDPDFCYVQLGDDRPADSGIIVTSVANLADHHGHVTILKVAGGGTDSTNLVRLFGDPDFQAVVVGDDGSLDSGIVVASSANQVDHKGHVTILKISNSGLDTTDIIQMQGDIDDASIQLNGGGGAGGSVVIKAGVSTTSGMIGVNTLSPTYEVDVVGTICATGGLCQQSDLRLKKNIKPMFDALPLVLSLNPVRYDWRITEFPDRQFSSDRQLGFIAQEVAEVLPELVSKDSEGIYALDYARFAPVLVTAIKEQNERISDQSEKIKKLQAELNELKALVRQMATRTKINSEQQFGSN